MTFTAGDRRAVRAQGCVEPVGQEKYPDVDVRREMPEDRPVRAPLAHAAAARLVVVGSHGHGGFAGMVSGSTSQALIQHAPVPDARRTPRPAQVTGAASLRGRVDT